MEKHVKIITPHFSNRDQSAFQIKSIDLSIWLVNVHCDLANSQCTFPSLNYQLAYTV